MPFQTAALPSRTLLCHARQHRGDAEVI